MKKPIKSTKKLADGGKTPVQKAAAVVKKNTKTSAQKASASKAVGSAAKKASGYTPGPLNKAELKALAHQTRGMGESGVTTYIGSRGSIQNTVGQLTDKENRQLKTNMSKASTGKAIYEGMPNVLSGYGASELPKGSDLKKRASYKKGGTKKEGCCKDCKEMDMMKKGGLFKKKTIIQKGNTSGGTETTATRSSKNYAEGRGKGISSSKKTWQDKNGVETHVARNISVGKVKVSISGAASEKKVPGHRVNNKKTIVVSRGDKELVNRRGQSVVTPNFKTRLKAKEEKKASQRVVSGMSVSNHKSGGTKKTPKKK